MTGAALPYGPETPAVRRFLVRLAGLGSSDRARVVERFAATAGERVFAAAEAALATAIERSGRETARDALSGPLLQLVQVADVPRSAAETDETMLASLDPVAEPALAALLALLVRDLLPAEQFAVLYAAFDDSIPAGDVVG